MTMRTTEAGRERIRRYHARCADANDRQSPLLIHVIRRCSPVRSYHPFGGPEHGIVGAAIAGNVRAVWELCGGAVRAQGDWDRRNPDLVDELLARNDAIAHGRRGRG